MSTITNLHRALLDPNHQTENWKAVAEKEGVQRLITAAKSEAVFLELVDKGLPSTDFFERDPFEASKAATNALRSMKITDQGTQKQFIEDHKTGKTHRILIDNLRKAADGAETEYFSGVAGFFRRIVSIFHTSGTLKEIQGLRDLAAKDLKQL